MPDKVPVEIDGRIIAVSNLDKVLYPSVGFTKAQVIDYYVRIATTMLPHVAGRGITLRRWPDGVDADSFFEKRCPSHRPDWLGTVDGPGDRGGAISYCCLQEPASLVWTANLAALEIHAPMAIGADLESPTMLVFDLDPGAPATITECCQVALRVRELLGGFDIEAFPKTSGSKGLQVYVPLNSPHSHDHCSNFALAVAQLLEKQTPKAVTSVMKKSVRGGRVFVDWSQNSRHKTTIAPYSMRAKDRPTVSTPLSWDEVAAGAEGADLVFVTDDVLLRVEEFGDLFAATQTLEQALPNPT